MISNEYKADYEEHFDRYVRKIIKRHYWRYVEKKKKEDEVLSLNVKCGDDIEIIETLIGANGIAAKDFCGYKEIEKIFEDEYVYKAVKSLTNTEKLAIFLCFILDLKRSEVARLMNLKYEESVIRIASRAIKKIRKNLAENGGDKND